MSWRLLCLWIGLCLACCSMAAPPLAGDNSPFLERARTVKAVESGRLLTLARKTLTDAVNDGVFTPVVSGASTEEAAPFGVFVTLVNRSGVTRGCFGVMEPMGRSLTELTAEAAVGAVRYDTRVRPVAPSELHTLQVIISLVGPQVPVVSMREVDPERHGLLVRAGQRNSVLLPGEARTSRWQLKRSLRQAGIRRGEHYEMFRFRTVTIYEH